MKLKAMLKILKRHLEDVARVHENDKYIEVKFELENTLKEQGKLQTYPHILRYIVKVKVSYMGLNYDFTYTLSGKKGLRLEVYRMNECVFAFGYLYGDNGYTVRELYEKATKEIQDKQQRTFQSLY